jgi:hypothetical protein
VSRLLDGTPLGLEIMAVDLRRPGLQGRLQTLRSVHRPRPTDEGSLRVAHISISIGGNGERKRVRCHGDPGLAGNRALDQLRVDMNLSGGPGPTTGRGLRLGLVGVGQTLGGR